MGTQITKSIADILQRLIDDYITYKVAGQAAVHKGRRQQLLREQGLLDILVQISKATPYVNRDEKNGGFVADGLNYFMLAGLHDIPQTLLEADRP